MRLVQNHFFMIIIKKCYFSQLINFYMSYICLNFISYSWHAIGKNSFVRGNKCIKLNSFYYYPITSIINVRPDNFWIQINYYIAPITYPKFIHHFHLQFVVALFVCEKTKRASHQNDIHTTIAGEFKTSLTWVLCTNRNTVKHGLARIVHVCMPMDGTDKDTRSEGVTLRVRKMLWKKKGTILKTSPHRPIRRFGWKDKRRTSVQSTP